MRTPKKKLLTYLLHKNNASYFFLWVSSGLVLLAITILFFVRSDENIQIRGEVSPKEGIFQIKSPSTSIVNGIYVADGDLVRKDQILFGFKGDFMKKELQDAELLSKISKKNLKKSVNYCKQSLDILKRKTLAANKILNSEKETFHMMKQLLNSGSISKLQVRQAFTNMTIREKEKLELESDLIQENEKCNSSILDKETRLSEINIKIVALKHQLSMLAVKSPINGYVYDIAPIAVGGVVQEKERVANIASKANLIIKSIAPGKDIGYLKSGKKVKIRIDSFPYTKYGVLDGKIDIVAPQRRLSAKKDTMITEDNRANISSSSEYTLTIRMDKTYFVQNGIKEDLKPGMEATILITIRNRPVIEYFTDIFKSFYDPLTTVR